MREIQTKAQKIWDRLIIPHLRLAIRKSSKDREHPFKNDLKYLPVDEWDWNYGIECEKFRNLTDEELDKMLNVTEFEKHEADHVAKWYLDVPKSNDRPFGGNLHFDCKNPYCEIYSESFRCPKCSRLMDLSEKSGGICGDCDLENGLVQNFGAVVIKKRDETNTDQP